MLAYITSTTLALLKLRNTTLLTNVWSNMSIKILGAEKFSQNKVGSLRHLKVEHTTFNALRVRLIRRTETNKCDKWTTIRGLVASFNAIITATTTRLRLAAAVRSKGWMSLLIVGTKVSFMDDGWSINREKKGLIASVFCRANEINAWTFLPKSSRKKARLPMRNARTMSC